MKRDIKNSKILNWYNKSQENFNFGNRNYKWLKNNEME